MLDRIDTIRPEDIRPPLDLVSFGLGIGRVVTAEWMQSFQAAFDYLATEGLAFQPRPEASMSYMGDIHAPLAEGIDPADREAAGEAWLSWFMRTGDIDEVSCQAPVTLKIDALRPFPKARSTDIKVRVLDKPSDFYPGGYQVSGEKAAVLAEFGINRPQSTQVSKRGPRSYVALGTIEGGTPATTLPVLRRIQKLAQWRVDFDPVSPIRVHDYTKRK